MPDVRDIVARLEPEDRAVWNEHRTYLRKCYLSAVNSTIGVDKFEQQDDSFLDLIDIRLALLFDRAGMLPTGLETITGKDESEKIEYEILAKEDAMKAGDKKPVSEPSDAIKSLGEWGKGK